MHSQVGRARIATRRSSLELREDNLNHGNAQNGYPQRVLPDSVSYGVACILFLSAFCCWCQQKAEQIKSRRLKRVILPTWLSFLFAAFLPHIFSIYFSGAHIFLCLSFVMVAPLTSTASFWLAFPLSRFPLWAVLISLWMRNLFALNLDVHVVYPICDLLYIPLPGFWLWLRLGAASPTGWLVGKGSTFRQAPCGMACPLPPCSRTYVQRTPSKWKCFHFNLQSLQNFNQLSPFADSVLRPPFCFPIFRLS